MFGSWFFAAVDTVFLPCAAWWIAASVGMRFACSTWLILYPFLAGCPHDQRVSVSFYRKRRIAVLVILVV